MPELNPKNALGPALREIRKFRGWTLQDVSERLKNVGMSCTAVQVDQIERQERGIADYEILYLCSALEVTDDDLGKHLNEAMERHLKGKAKRQ